MLDPLRRKSSANSVLDSSRAERLVQTAGGTWCQGHLSNTFFTRYRSIEPCATLDTSQEGNNPELLMEPKNTTATTPNLPILNPAIDEVEVWDAPFERWIHLADALLERDRVAQLVDRL